MIHVGVWVESPLLIHNVRWVEPIDKFIDFKINSWYEGVLILGRRRRQRLVGRRRSNILVTRRIEVEFLKEATTEFPLPASDSVGPSCVGVGVSGTVSLVINLGTHFALVGSFFSS